MATDAGDMQMIATDVAAAGAEERVECFTAGSAASFGYSTSNHTACATKVMQINSHGPQCKGHLITYA